MWKANCLDLVLICEQLGAAVIAVAELCGCLGPRGWNWKNVATVLLFWLPCMLR